MHIIRPEIPQGRHLETQKNVPLSFFRIGELPPVADITPLPPQQKALLRRFYAAVMDKAVAAMPIPYQVSAIKFALRGIESLPVFEKTLVREGEIADYFARSAVCGPEGLTLDENAAKLRVAFIERNTPVGRLANRIMHLGLTRRAYAASQRHGRTMADPDILQHRLGITLDDARHIVDIDRGNARTNVWWSARPHELLECTRPDFPNPAERNRNSDRISELVESTEALKLAQGAKAAATSPTQEVSSPNTRQSEKSDKRKMLTELLNFF